MSNRIALVTGASQGIGRAVALELARRGAHVALAARNVEKLIAVEAEITSAGGAAKAFALDVANEDSIKSGVKAVVEHFGKVAGNGTTELRFKTQQINDVLKSLVLQDLDGGKVTTITYASQDPVSKTLRSFQVDITGNPSLAELLGQLRGAKLTVGIGAEKVETILGMNVASQISTSIDIAAATNAGTPIIAASPQHPSSSAFRNLSTLLLGDQAPVTSSENGRRAEPENERFAKLFRIKR